MMLLVLLCFLAVVCGVHYPKLCKRLLEAVLRSSPSYAEGYFARLDEELRKHGPLLFSSQSSAVIENFENTFGVTVTSYAPFGSSQCNVYLVKT